MAAGITWLSQAGSQGQLVNVAEIIRYPGYVSQLSGKDVALATNLDTLLPNISTISWAGAYDVSSGRTDPGVLATVTGWGALYFGGPSSNQLQEVDVPIVSNQAAQSAYGPYGVTITSDQLAAGDLNNGGEDTCQADSGGPLTVQGPGFFGFPGPTILAGVVSWGAGCANASFPGMYARVSSFESWLDDNVCLRPAWADDQ